MLNCSRMAGAATEILLRSMYVSRYMRLIKNRTIHRVFVGLRAASIEAASEVRTGGRLVSNNLSVTVTGARSEAINRRATMLGKFRFREPRFQSVRFSSRVRTKTRLKTEPTSKRHRAKSMPLTITRLRVRARPRCVGGNISRLIPLHDHSGMLGGDEGLASLRYTLEEMDCFGFHGTRIHMRDSFAGHGRNGELNAPLHRIQAYVAMSIVHHDGAFGSDHLNPCR